MWWCCGKKDEKARGCKIGSHINEVEEEDEQEKAEQLK